MIESNELAALTAMVAGALTARSSPAKPGPTKPTIWVIRLVAALAGASAAPCTTRGTIALAAGK